MLPGVLSICGHWHCYKAAHSLRVLPQGGMLWTPPLKDRSSKSTPYTVLQLNSRVNTTAVCLVTEPRVSRVAASNLRLPGMAALWPLQPVHGLCPCQGQSLGQGCLQVLSWGSVPVRGAGV